MAAPAVAAAAAVPIVAPVAPAPAAAPPANAAAPPTPKYLSTWIRDNCGIGFSMARHSKHGYKHRFPYPAPEPWTNTCVGGDTCAWKIAKAVGGFFRCLLFSPIQMVIVCFTVIVSYLWWAPTHCRDWKGYLDHSRLSTFAKIVSTFFFLLFGTIWLMISIILVSLIYFCLPWYNYLFSQHAWVPIETFRDNQCIRNHITREIIQIQFALWLIYGGHRVFRKEHSSLEWVHWAETIFRVATPEKAPLNAEEIQAHLNAVNQREQAIEAHKAKWLQKTAENKPCLVTAVPIHGYDRSERPFSVPHPHSLRMTNFQDGLREYHDLVLEPATVAYQKDVECVLLDAIPSFPRDLCGLISQFLPPLPLRTSREAAGSKFDTSASASTGHASTNSLDGHVYQLLLQGYRIKEVVLTNHSAFSTQFLFAPPDLLELPEEVEMTPEQRQRCFLTPIFPRIPEVQKPTVTSGSLSSNSAASLSDSNDIHIDIVPQHEDHPREWPVDTWFDHPCMRVTHRPRIIRLDTGEFVRSITATFHAGMCMTNLEIETSQFRRFVMELSEAPGFPPPYGRPSVCVLRGDPMSRHMAPNILRTLPTNWELVGLHRLIERREHGILNTFSIGATFVDHGKRLPNFEPPRRQSSVATASASISSASSNPVQVAPQLPPHRPQRTPATPHTVHFHMPDIDEADEEEVSMSLHK